MMDSSGGRLMRCWLRPFSTLGLTRFPRRNPTFVRREWRFDDESGEIDIRCAGVDSGGRAGLAGWHGVDAGLHEPGGSAENYRNEVRAFLEPVAPNIVEER